jgi:hypothetical protein
MFVNSLSGSRDLALLGSIKGTRTATNQVYEEAHLAPSQS